MATLTTACYTVLMFYFQPLGGNEHLHHDQDFSQHVFGMWFGFVLSAGLISWFVVGMANTLRSRDQLLAQVREQALRDEQLIALGTLATGAAHELGTPLATMAVVTRELERTNHDENLTRKFTILRDQVERCKKALSVISASAGEARAEGGSLVAIDAFLETVTREWRTQRPDVEFSVDIEPGPAHAKIVDEYTLHQSLANLFNNAADASTEPLAMQANWDAKQLEITILDRGPGLRPQVMETIDMQKSSRKEYGMGLGLFLTHATIRRLGGDIELFDRSSGGTCTRIQLPLSAFGATQ
jgi:two-component system sensor histidine kinase RegB